MWIAWTAGVVAAWLLVAAAGALLLGRAVRVADRRRPRTVRRRGRAALDRVVTIATGAIPVIRPHVLRAVTGSLPVVRPR